MPDGEQAQAAQIPVISIGEVVAYCQREGWVVVGFDLQLLIRPDETVRVAVVALDKRNHMLAISPVSLEGSLGLGNP